MVSFLNKKEKYLGIILAVGITVFVVWTIVFGATTISSNINTGGTLTVSGDSYLANASTTGMMTVGNGFISKASSTVAGSLQIAGSIQASSSVTIASTVDIAGLSTLAGFISRASSTISSSLHVSSILRSSSTLSAGTSTLTNLIVTNTSSSTFAGPISNTSGNLIIAPGSGTNHLFLNPYSHSLLGTDGGSVTIGSTTNFSAYELDINKTINGVVGINVNNFSTGGAAQSTVCLGQDFLDQFGCLEYRNSGVATTGLVIPKSLRLSASSGVSGGLVIFNTDPQPIIFGTNNAEIARFNSSGLLGIGTSTPSQPLSVHGNALFSGNITSVANITATGTLTVTRASTTGMLTVDGGFISSASSTFSANLLVSGPLSASSTLNVGGVLTATSTATTTIALQADANAEGGCIQLRAANGKLYRMYIAGNDDVAFGTTTSGRPAAIVAVWELGACQ